MLLLLAGLSVEAALVAVLRVLLLDAKLAVDTPLLSDIVMGVSVKRCTVLEVAESLVRDVLAAFVLEAR